MCIVDLRETAYLVDHINQNVNPVTMVVKSNANSRI